MMNLLIGLSRVPGSPFLFTALSLPEFGKQVANVLKTTLHRDFIGETDLIITRPVEIIPRDPNTSICSVSLEHVRSDVELDDHDYQSTVSRLEALFADVISQRLRQGQTLDLVTSLYVDPPLLTGATGPSKSQFGGLAFLVQGLWDGQRIPGEESGASSTFVSESLASMGQQPQARAN